MDKLKYLLSLKNNQNLQNIDYNLIQSILLENNIKKTNINKNVLKTKTLSSRINLILNKLTENNIMNILNEFITNIYNINETDFENIQNIIYNKILNDFKFIENYITFLLYISYIYDFNLSYFINILEYNIKLDYNIIENFEDVEEKYKFILNDINNYNENKRKNNLNCLILLIKNNVLNESILDKLDNIIINQDYHIIDIYNWFNLKNKYNYKLSQDNINNIKNICNTNTINKREQVLLLSLIN
jgi:hypothetical protein